MNSFLPEDQVVREALQARLLAELFANTVRRELILKGGMAMRTLFHSHRATKDVDLDSPQEEPKALVQGLVRRSIQRVLADGLIEDAVVTTPKQTDTTLRWKIGGRVPGGHSEVHLTVEVSRRGNIPNDHIIRAPLPPTPAHRDPTVVVYDAQALAVNKIMAMTSPNRTAARDLYDLAVLIELKITPPVALLARQGAERIEAALKDLWLKVEAMDWDQFDKNVIPFLPPAIAAKFDAVSFAEMQINVGETVESWLRQAAAQATTAGPAEPPPQGNGKPGKPGKAGGGKGP